MCSPFSCGSFKNQKDDIDELPSPCSTTPNRSKRGRSYSKRRDSKNPYANQGLDKFNALLAELEEKKQKIYTQKGSEDISFIYFKDSSNCNDWKPIIAKVKKQENSSTNYNAKDDQITKYSEAQNMHEIEASASFDEVPQPKEELISRKRPKNWRQIFGDFPVTIVLILLVLIMYGRSFAILCTILGWYLVPLIKDKSSSSTSKRPKKRNDIVKDGSSSASSSPKSVLSGPAENTFGLHAYRKNW
ncbi:hypothetical protein ACH5RR_034892 [Cinchona calisaya]|uniref:ZCF37 n=1 Tax=Cinchona calisaya TaxID=153742 RepID=A0ABD2YDK6_9GENT